jgi:Uma2 family endonuclease
MTDEEFAELCSEHPDLFFEMSAEGELIVALPPYSLTGIRQGKIFAQLNQWAEQDGRGIAGEASTAFVLPNGARRSPDAAWIRKERIRQLDAKMIERYWHLCPDFVIELRSQTDRLRTIREKMREWVENGAQLAWLIDPETRSVEIYRSTAEPELLTTPERLLGEGLVEGFLLQLAPIWDPLGS